MKRRWEGSHGEYADRANMKDRDHPAKGNELPASNPSEESEPQMINLTSKDSEALFPDFGDREADSSKLMVVSGRKMKVPWKVPEEGFPGTMNNRPHTETKFANAFSPSGLDVVGLLIRVATRPNPEIDIGSVDYNCAFIVSDAEKADNPIIYCSPGFEVLTGYSSSIVVGRNCRFLQSPDGIVDPGSERKYVDNEPVKYMKEMILAGREVQIPLTNYRRGGQSFTNLVTIIPITSGLDAPARVLVGFQIELRSHT